jgi:hypothetical protein
MTHWLVVNLSSGRDVPQAKDVSKTCHSETFTKLRRLLVPRSSICLAKLLSGFHISTGPWMNLIASFCNVELRVDFHQYCTDSYHWADSSTRWKKWWFKSLSLQLTRYPGWIHLSRSIQPVDVEIRLQNLRIVDVPPLHQVPYWSNWLNIEPGADLRLRYGFPFFPVRNRSRTFPGLFDSLILCSKKHKKITIQLW